MSTTIDERVVSMQFDNKHFEKNVQTSISTIDKLKQSLDFKQSSKSFENLEATATRAGFHIQDVWEKVTRIFEYNIAGKITGAITNMAKALTLDPITTGFKEYETQIGAIQTILANTESKGTTLDDVNGALDELNAYADKTIYNFTEMTRNIGTFTAAGTDLDTSVKAIKGIANLAAVSGSTSQQASTAMYQLSQAMASGTVKLMDWNSVVNAGMGGQVFQDALKETAKVHGVAIDDIIKKQGSFRESLSEGWLTTEILTETLEKFTLTAEEGTAEWDELIKSLKAKGYTEEQAKEILKMGNTATDAATKVKTFTQLWDTLKEAAQSGWSQTWEIIVGDFEEAKSFLTEVSDTIGGLIGKSAEARNEVLENWKVLGGREDLIESIRNAFESVVSIVKPIGEAFREIFPPLTAKKLVAFTKGLKELTEKLKLSDTASDNLKRTFKGLFAIADIVVQIFKSAFKAVGSLFGSVTDLGGGLLDATATFGDFLVGVRDFIKSSGIIDKVFQGIAEVIKAALKGASSFIKFIKDKFALPGWELFHTLLEKIQGGMSGVGEAAGGMKDFVVSAFDSIGAALEGSSFVKLLQGVWNVIKTIGSGIAKVFGALTGGLVDALGNANFDGFLGILNSLISGGILVSIVNFIKGITDPLNDMKEFVGGFMGNIQGILDGVRGSLEGFQSKLKAESLQKIAIAVGILAASLLVLSFIEPDKLGTATAAIAALFAELLIAMSIANKITAAKGIAKTVGSIVALSSALLILSVAAKILSTISLEQMGVGLLGISVGLAALVTAVNFLPEKKVKSAASAIKKMSSALLVLSIAMKIMSTMSWEEMGVGLVTTVVGLGALVAAANLLPKDMALRSLGIMSLATALLILSGAMKIMSTMSWEEMGVGLVTLAGSMVILVASMNLMKKALPGAVAMFIIAPALIELALALKIMSSMSMEEIGRGLLALGGAMAIMAIGLNSMRKTLLGSAALLVAAAALAVMAPVLSFLGAMSLASIGKSLLVLAGAFTVIGVAAKLLTPVLPAILGLSVAMALIGAGTLAAGAGLLAFGTGLSAIAVGFTAVAASLPAVISGIIGIVTAFITGIGKGIIALCKVIADGAPAIGEAVKAVVLSLCDVLVECVPAIADTVLKLIAGLLDKLVTYTPQIVDSLFQFILGLLRGISENIPELIQAVVDIFVSVFTGAVAALSSIDSSSLIEGILAVGLMTGLVAALGAIVPLIPSAMVGVLGMGVVITELAIVLAAIGALAQIPGLQWLVSEGGNFLQLIGTAIGQFIGGIIGGIAMGATSALPQIGTDLSTFMGNLQPFIDGAKSIDESVLNGVKSLVGVILAITGANLLEGITSWITGGSSITTFANELPILGRGLKGFSDSVSGIVPENIIAASNAAKVLAEMTSVIPNEGGVVGWFTGENSISKFAGDIIMLGQGLKGFSDAVVGIVPENIIAASNAAKVLAEMTATIPNEGGVASWFAGDNSISKFANDIIALGFGLKGFSDATIGIVPENIVAAANAAKALADMTAVIPNQGGIASWFAGDNSISKFASELPKLGQGLKGFSTSVLGIVPENIVGAALAAKALAEMTAVIPNQGGVAAWFTGESSITKFASELPKLGTGLKSFSVAVTGINSAAVITAVTAAKDLAQMISVIPAEGGIKAWFSGEQSITKFAGDLPKLGEGLAGFGTKVAGINPEKIKAAASAAKSLGDMTSVIPTNTNKIKTFGDNLVGFGTDLNSFMSKVKGISADSTSNVSKAVKVIESIAKIDSGNIKSVAKAIDTFTKSVSNMAKDIKSDLKDAGKEAIESFIKGIDGKLDAAKKACKAILDACVDALEGKSADFETAGKQVVQGFANGIGKNIYLAEAKAAAMAKAAKKAAEEALGIESPSKELYKDGRYTVLGFANGISDYADMAYGVGYSVAETAKDGFSKAISKIGGLVNSDMNLQPTIRPVLDLSDIRNGASSINDLIGAGTSVGVMSNVNSISTMMRGFNQNGANFDVVSAIDKLRKDLGNVGNTTYNVNGITYDDGSNISEAVQSLMRAARVERRI